MGGLVRCSGDVRGQAVGQPDGGDQLGVVLLVISVVAVVEGSDGCFEDFGGEVFADGTGFFALEVVGGGVGGDDAHDGCDHCVRGSGVFEIQGRGCRNASRGSRTCVLERTKFRID